MANECEYCGHQPNHGCDCFKIKCEDCGTLYYEATMPLPKPQLCSTCYYKRENFNDGFQKLKNTREHQPDGKAKVSLEDMFPLMKP